MRIDDALPNTRDIENLAGYLPILYSPDFNPVQSTGGGEHHQNGVIDTPYPIYHAIVNKFFAEASNNIWMDFEYKPEEQQNLIKDERYIQSATIENIKSLITYCVRGEKFCDGHWNRMIKKGYIQNILKRLQTILYEMPHE
ncbi:DUF6508 domain-containing protein [Thiomicrorhabdus sp. Milos-T2]|uniref:DUF6508 domain-containing protein n=1 Tax=Thiomicrorhabdus sp. Milos-T2 TaxID=90814 RepID=UPI000494ACC7|nr:DUF6508 domain-containing protein [Thiomicrorhabdus sp. Milos-T2]